MTVPYPLTPAPDWYGMVTWGGGNGFPLHANWKAWGIHYVGDTVTIHVVIAGKDRPYTIAPAPTAYFVTDLNGNTVSSGAVSGTVANWAIHDGDFGSDPGLPVLDFVPTPPVGGWKPGWYRVHLTGPNTDTLFGNSYGGGSFVVFRDDPNWRHETNSSDVGLGVGEGAVTDAKGVCGIGTSRLIWDVSQGSSPTTAPAVLVASGLGNTNANLHPCSEYWTTAPQPQDSVRPRALWANTPGFSVDVLFDIGGINYFVKTAAVNGTTTFVRVAAGSVSGAKITIESPTAGAVVETYDNLANSTVAIAAMASSAYVKVFVGGNPSNFLNPYGPTAIGNANCYAHTAALSAAFYAAGIHYMEGPVNEFGLGGFMGHAAYLFASAVHAGNASMKAIGPTPVAINDYAGWQTFINNGGAAALDGLAFHAYNSMNNDINLGRAQWDAFTALLAANGLSGKELWQTESTSVMVSHFGVYMPRTARMAIFQTLFLEQYGIPKEHNNYWYDGSHGFWSVPVFWVTGNGLEPHAVLYRVLSEELFGKAHYQRLNMGIYGEHVFLGSVFRAPDTSSVVVLMSGLGVIDNATVTLAVTGTAGPLVVIDGQGNQTSATITNGRASVPVADGLATYVRIPAGATATVDHCNDWPTVGSNAEKAWQNTALNGDASTAGTNGLSGGSTAVAINDGKFMTAYIGNWSSPGVFHDDAALPTAATIKFRNATRHDRAFIWSGPAYQFATALYDFDVQTSMDGTTWTTRATVTKTPGSSFAHASDGLNGNGCQRETYADPQSFFDVKYPGGPVVARYMRLQVRSTTWADMPDQACSDFFGYGAPAPGWLFNAQHIVLQDVAVVCDDNTKPRYATIH